MRALIAMIAFAVDVGYKEVANKVELQRSAEALRYGKSGFFPGAIAGWRRSKTADVAPGEIHSHLCQQAGLNDRGSLCAGEGVFYDALLVEDSSVLDLRGWSNCGRICRDVGLDCGGLLGGDWHDWYQRQHNVHECCEFVGRGQLAHAVCA